MKKRQIIIIATAIGILVIGKLVGDLLGKPKDKKAKPPRTNITTVFTQVVENDSVPIYIESTGVLKAIRRIELFSEVQGVMEADNGRFKAGNSFRKGDLLINIRSNDQEAQLFAQRSSFESALTSIMPDLKVDFPDDFKKWEEYLIAFSTTSSVRDLPEVKSEKLNSFLVGRGIYRDYHSLKNLEIINAKYSLRAPYDGVLIKANVDPGTVIRPGQALGTFIQADSYEMETSVDAVSADKLQIGQKVELSMQGIEDKKWEGTISRLVKAIDVNSQMSTFFVKVDSEDLKEGMFLQAKVEARKIPNSFQLSRSSLIDKDQVYVVQADSLVLKEITNEYFTQNEVVISGLKDGEVVLNKVPPSAFPGMKVSVYKEEK